MDNHAHLPKLGAFVVERLLASGGMGEVWQGWHRFQHVPVAIKFITGSNARNSRYIKAFRREVESAARLHHTGIIAVYDYGIVDVNAEAASAHQLVAGSPYLVMEMAGEPLADLKLPVPWPLLRRLMLQILDALAHAHARGVVHRDLKPGNVLFGLDGTTPKLSDFGIAQALAQTLTDVGSSFSGTPAYLAPEQLIGDARDLGAWSDLYSLGAMAYELATGKLPFQANTMMAMIQAHIYKPPPRLVSDDYPEGFSNWIARLMKKSPIQRFYTAADAAWDLLRQCPAEDGDDEFAGPATARYEMGHLASMNGDGLDDATVRTLDPVPEGAVIAKASIDGAEANLLTMDGGVDAADTRPETRETLEGSLHLSALSGVVELSHVSHVMSARGQHPGIPTDWSQTEMPPHVQLMGAGLGLYGLRGLGVVGRVEERNALWSSFKAVHDTGIPHVAVIRGMPGMGASRLAQWLAVRAYEVGGAWVLRARHESTPNKAQGMGRMMARFLRSVRVKRKEAEKRVDSFLKCGISIGPEVLPAEMKGTSHPQHMDGVAALMDVIAPSLKDGGLADNTVRSNPMPILRTVFELMTRDRPILFWIDDAQWGGEALEFALALANMGDLPVLILCVVNDQVLEEGQRESAQLQGLATLAPTVDFRIGPLPFRDQVDLVRSYCGLEPHLAEQVADQTKGNPLFAIQLVGDWVKRRMLSPGPNGYVLREGEPAVPVDIDRLWLDRLTTVDHEFVDDAPTVHQALELGAALGREVDFIEWNAVCEAAGLVLPDQVLERLENCDLIDAFEESWKFRHEVLRETIANHSRGANRWPSHQLVCAETLTELGVAPERRAEHWSEAGELRRAAEELLTAAARCRAGGELAQSIAFLDERDVILAQSGVDFSDRLRQIGVVRRADALLAQGRVDMAVDSIERARLLAYERGWEDVAAEVEMARGHGLMLRGELDASAQAFEVAGRFAERISNHVIAGRTLHARSLLKHIQGQLDEARDLATAAVERFRSIRDDRGVGVTLIALAELEDRAGHWDRAEAHLADALSRLNFVGDRIAMGKALNLLGEISRHRGRLDDAETLYRRAWSHLHGAQTTVSMVARLNLGLVLLLLARYDEAYGHLDAVRGQLEATGQSVYRIPVMACLMACCAGRQTFDEFDAWYALLSHSLSESPNRQHDVATPIELAGDLSAQAGADDQARLAWLLALEHYEVLLDTEAVARVRGRLGM